MKTTLKRLYAARILREIGDEANREGKTIRPIDLYNKAEELIREDQGDM